MIHTTPRCIIAVLPKGASKKKIVHIEGCHLWYNVGTWHLLKLPPSPTGYTLIKSTDITEEDAAKCVEADCGYYRDYEEPEEAVYHNPIESLHSLHRSLNSPVEDSWVIIKTDSHDHTL